MLPATARVCTPAQGYVHIFNFSSQRLFLRGSSLPVSDSFCLLMFSSLPRVNFQNIPVCSFSLDFLFCLFFSPLRVSGEHSYRILSREGVLCPTVREGRRALPCPLGLFCLGVYLLMLRCYMITSHLLGHFTPATVSFTIHRTFSYIQLIFLVPQQSFEINWAGIGIIVLEMSM